MMAAMVCVGFASCGSDDDEDSGNTGNLSSKHIVNKTYSDGTIIETTNYEYDSQGRIIKASTTDTYTGRSSSATTTYTYGDNTIISKTQGDWNNGEVHTYKLTNGVITEEEERRSGSTTYTYQYTYDNDGHLASLSGSENIQFTWTNGNLTELSKYYSSGSYTISISYSNIPWPKNWQQYWEGTNLEVVFEPLGSWGKMPKYLPTSFSKVESDERFSRSGGWSIDYTVKDGNVIKVTIQDVNGSTPEVYTIEWE